MITLWVSINWTLLSSELYLYQYIAETRTGINPRGERGGVCAEVFGIERTATEEGFEA